LCGRRLVRHFVRRANYNSGYKLFLTFKGGADRIAGLTPHLEGEIFEPVRDVEFFRRFIVNPGLDTVVWENNADL
jgi:hypothetical protein